MAYEVSPKNSISPPPELQVISEIQSNESSIFNTLKVLNQPSTGSSPPILGV